MVESAAGPASDLPAIDALTVVDLPAAIELSTSANWNQNADDWRTLLTLGQGFGIRDADDSGRHRLVASAVTLPYGDRFAWVSMVLVLPAFRRRWYATRLLRHCTQHLAAQGRSAVLDATPAGRAVYVQEGFADSWTFSRYRRESVAAPAPAGPAIDRAVRALRESDWPSISALDTPAFGADRVALLRTLGSRWPQAARVVERDGALRGFVLGRGGREAYQIGPLLAEDATAARALIDTVLAVVSAPVYLDLLDTRSPALRSWLQQQGFVPQRPFTRMVRGAARAPGDPTRVWAVAGPELG